MYSDFNRYSQLSFAVPNEPISLEIVSVNSSSVTLQWRPPEIPNGVITHYSLQFDATVIDHFGSSMHNMLMGTVKGLSPDTVYLLRLTASTGVGVGLPSSITVITCKLLKPFTIYCSYICDYIL